MKKTFIILILGALSFSASAQNRKEFENDFKRRMAEYSDTRRQDFQSYCDSLNMEFAEFMRKRWEKHDILPPVPLPPDAPAPDIPERTSAAPKFATAMINVSVPATQPDRQKRPKPIADFEDVATPSSSWFEAEFIYYGAYCSVPVKESLYFSLNGIDENSVADAWIHLTERGCAELIPKCIGYRERMNLCDWGYISFVEELTRTIFAEDEINEARIMQMYILAQSGYKVRIARAGNRLVLLLPSSEDIYQYMYLNINGEKYYVLDRTAGSTPLYLFDRGLAGEQEFSLQMDGQPFLSGKNDKINSTSISDIILNKNLLAFYNDYPHSADWSVYVLASISDGIRQHMISLLKEETAGMNKTQKAGFLLNFVQKAFKYMTDGEQFGYERPLFCDETFYYPYSDCEDRAILFATLVRELLGLDAVLLDYPGHIATAVCFEEEVGGYYFLIDGRRYTVCDPTYIGAGIGESMPQFVDEKAIVVRISTDRK